MEEITDEFMRGMLRTARQYTIVILRRTGKRDEPGVDAIVWEHGRRNFELRRDGKLLIVCPITDDTEVRGLCIFSTGVDETREIMEGDQAVKAGIFTYEIHPALGFPGDRLAGGASPFD